MSTVCNDEACMKLNHIERTNNEGPLIVYGGGGLVISIINQKETS